MWKDYSHSDIYFSAPDAWMPAEVDGVIEFVDANSTAAIHLSVLKKVAIETPLPKEAVALVENMKLNNHLVPMGESEVFANDFSVRASIYCSDPSAIQSDAPKYWYIFGIVWADKAARLTCCADSLNAEGMLIAKEIAASLKHA